MALLPIVVEPNWLCPRADLFLSCGCRSSQWLFWGAQLDCSRGSKQRHGHKAAVYRAQVSTPHNDHSRGRQSKMFNLPPFSALQPRSR